jgi:galactokinase
MWNLALEPLERAQCALSAEREFVGVRCGIMDPYAVGLARSGEILWLDCRDETFEHLPLDHDSVSIVVADTGVRRELAQGAFNQRVQEASAAFEALAPRAPGARCLRDVPRSALEAARQELEPVLARRAQHVVDEVERTFAARDALARQDLAGFGASMYETHASLRDLYEVSVPELDELVDGARASSAALGARLTGAGFGGCVVILAKRARASELAESVGAGFERRFGRRPAIEVFGGDGGPREVTPA